MDENKNYSDLKKFCQSKGMELFGVADIGKIKKDFLLSDNSLEKLDKAVALGVSLSKSILEEIKDAPTPLYFHHYRAVNTFLDQAALGLCNYIQKKGYAALPIPASFILDWQNQRAHLSHKKIGFLAGLGWIGRNNLLVNKLLGSQFRLVSVLTNLPLKLDKPTGQNCGDCMLCIKACPASAVKDNPSDFNHIKCFEKLKEFQRRHLVHQYICGVCVKACAGRK